MSVLNRHMTERQMQDTIMEAAELRGYLVFHDNDSRRNNPGFPDTICVNPRNGTILVYELKAGKRPRIRPMQREWVEAFMGGHVESSRFVYPDDLDDVLKELEECA